MKFPKPLKKLIEKTRGGEIIHDFETISETEDSTYQYIVNAKLRRRKDDHFCLQLNLKRSWQARDESDDYKAFLFFKDYGEVLELLKDVQDKIKNEIEPTGEQIHSKFISGLLHATGHQIIYNYGRIDNHPHKNWSKKTEMALIHYQDKYQLYFCFQDRDFFYWPVNLMEELRKLEPEIREYTALNRKKD